MTDLRTDSPTCTSASQKLASKAINPTSNQKKGNNKSDKNGTNRTRVLTGHERTDCHNFRELYTRISRMQGEGVPRINRIRKDRHGEKPRRGGDIQGERLMSISRHTSQGERPDGWDGLGFPSSFHQQPLQTSPYKKSSALALFLFLVSSVVATLVVLSFLK